MKKHITTLASIFTFVVFTAFTPATLTDGFYRINTETSNIEWSGSKITGKVHSGTVNLTSGGLQLKDGKISNGKFTIDMTSLVCTDIEDPKWNKKLVGHLTSEDFFGVDKFKTANVVILSVDVNGNVKANLTIKGVTNEVVFPTTVTVNNKTVTATATIEVDRTKFGIRFGFFFR